MHVEHHILLAKLARTIADRDVLRLVKKKRTELLGRLREVFASHRS
jgi:hypothetical protein